MNQKCDCDCVPVVDFIVKIGPVRDNCDGPYILEHRDGKWLLLCSLGTVIREVSDEEIANMQFSF